MLTPTLWNAFTAEESLEPAPHSIKLQAEDDYHAAQTVIPQGLSSTVFQKDTTSWKQWIKFCRWYHISPELQGIDNPIPFFQIFAERTNYGILSTGGGHQTRSTQLSNNSVPLEKYFPPWGPTTPRTTNWTRSNFGWYASLYHMQKRNLILQKPDTYQLTSPTTCKPTSNAPPPVNIPPANSPGYTSSSYCNQENNYEGSW